MAIVQVNRKTRIIELFFQAAIVKILILGCGQVGAAIAQELALTPSNNITIIDTDEQALKSISSRLDVRTMIGNGASPVMLENAGADDTEMLLALTRSDEINLVACHLSSKLFNIPKRIVRVRHSDYLEYGLSEEEIEDGDKLSGSLNAFSVTDFIHPEQLVTEHLIGLLNYVRALQVLSFAHDTVRMVVAQSKAGDKIVGESIGNMQTWLPENSYCQICAIYRNNRLIIPEHNTIIEEGDEICFIVDSLHMSSVMYVLFQFKQNNHRMMLAGGGNVGYRLAKKLEDKFHIKIIEYNEKRAEWLSENLNNTLILKGSATDEALLEREYIDEIDVFVAVTNDDENNIMSSLLAKNLGAKRVITLVNRSRYMDLLIGNHIDIVVSPHQITIGNVLAHIRRGDVVAVHALRHGTAEAIEVVVHGDERTSSLVGRHIDEIKWPKGCRVAVVVRDKTVLLENNPILNEGDRLVFFVARRRVLRELEKLIQVKMGFFGKG